MWEKLPGSIARCSTTGRHTEKDSCKLGGKGVKGSHEPLAVCDDVRVCLDPVVQHCGQIQQC